MQVKTQIMLENIAMAIGAMIIFFATLAYVADDDSETDTDFHVRDNTIEVHIKQFGRADIVVYKDCVMLAQKVEC